MPRRAPPPASLPHQVEGTAFLRENERAALFDEQGLGKSKQLIDAITGEIAAGSIQCALIVCPNTLKVTWAEEIERFSEARYAVFGAGKKARRLAFSSLLAEFYVINYEAVAAELPSLRALAQFKRMALVLDEGHRIKSPDSKVTRAILALRTVAARRYLLTGTPVANKPEDLWSQMLFLDDGAALGESFELFQERYKSGTGYQNVEEIRHLVSGVSLRRTKEESLNLPPKVYHRVSVPLAERQQAMYDQLRSDLAVWVQTLSGDQVEKNAEAILARIVRLAQIASNPALLDAGYRETPAKFLKLDALLERYISGEGRKVIVWTSFVGNIKTLAARYEQYGVVTISGEQVRDERQDAVRQFRQDGDVRLLIANPAAAREGLTLTEASIAIYIDRTFNLVDYLQSQDRIHRISQTRECDILLLIGTHTIDEFIDFSLEQKHRLAAYSQSDRGDISDDDLALEKPDLLRALLAPV
jgi:SNF2 family DNA or RNA helicase